MSQDQTKPIFVTELVDGLLNYDRTKKTQQPRGVQTTMVAFLESFSLHDSYWKSLDVENLDSALVIIFDPHWSKITKPTPWVKKWPRLIISMRGLVEARFGFGDVNHSSSILDAESAQHPDLESKAITTFELDPGKVVLTHDSIVELRMIDPDGQFIPIPL